MIDLALPFGWPLNGRKNKGGSVEHRNKVRPSLLAERDEEASTRLKKRSRANESCPLPIAFLGYISPIARVRSKTNQFNSNPSISRPNIIHIKSTLTVC